MTRLPEVIAKHSNRKPIMIFCFTRNSAINTSKILAELWAATNASDRLWPGATKHVQVMDPDLRSKSGCRLLSNIDSDNHMKRLLLLA